MERVLWIETNGKMKVVELEEDAFLRGLQLLVAGNIEVLPIAPDLALIVNEEGLLLDLEYNLVASQFMNMHLVGDAVLCSIGLRDGEMDIIGLTPNFVELAKQILDKRNPS